jgi:hypothetical protein
MRRVHWPGHAPMAHVSGARLGRASPSMASSIVRLRSDGPARSGVAPEADAGLRLLGGAWRRSEVAAEGCGDLS